jgi:hypothetical protein
VATVTCRNRSERSSLGRVILRPASTGAALGSFGKGTAERPRAVACQKCLAIRIHMAKRRARCDERRSPKHPIIFLRRRGARKLTTIHTTTEHQNLPFTGIPCRQSHFRLRVSPHRASVALCLSTGLVNLFLPQPSSFSNTVPQLRTRSIGSNQEARHCIYFRPAKICRLTHHTS